MLHEIDQTQQIGRACPFDHDASRDAQTNSVITVDIVKGENTYSTLHSELKMKEDPCEIFYKSERRYTIYNSG